MGHVVPYVASEILTCEMPDMIEAFFYGDDGNTPDTSLFEYYLDGLFSQQLSQQQIVNPVLAGYLEKIF
jgi:hypothetical protein